MIKTVRIMKEEDITQKPVIEDVDTEPDTQVSAGHRAGFVNIVGNPNVGKSTLMNLLSKSEVFAENKLFATLDEVREADVLVHVVDISHPNFEEQIEVVNKTLADVCGKSDKPVIMVFNKIDAFSYTPKDPDDLTPVTRENVSLPELQRTWMSRMDNNCVFISAKDKLNIEELKQKLYEKAREIHTERFPYNDFLYQKYEDLEAEAQDPDKEDLEETT